MSNEQETLVKRFWSHVFNTPEEPSVLLPNEDKTPRVIVAGTGGGMAPSVVTVQPEPVVELSWAEAGLRVAMLMSFIEKTGFKRGDRIAILAWNSPEWVWTDLAVQSLGGITVPIYPNNAADGVNYVVNDAGANLVLSDSQEQLDKVDTTDGVKVALFSEAVPTGTASAVAANPLFDSKLTAAQSVLRHIKSELAAPADGKFLGISHDDIFTLIYTSGSTGQPKGVILTHGNVANECTACVRHGLEMGDRDVYLSYLPLAHVYERVNGTAIALWNGVPSAYCAVTEVASAVKLYKPTVLVGVPAVWRKMNDGIQAQLNAATGLKAKLIAWALRQKKPGWKRWLADLLVFRKVRAGLGGRLRIMMSGGAAISPDILRNFELFSLPLRQGYGLSETTGGLSFTTDKANKTGSVGKVIDVVDVKIVPTKNAPPGSGEILVRGRTVMAGYWKMPDATAETFDDEWFKTGDLGYVDEDGYLFITGRKKRLFKTEGGKYVAPEKVEKAFDGDAIAHYVVPVGDNRKYITALIFVNQEEAATLVSGDKVSGDPAEFYAGHPKVVAAVQGAVHAANTKLEHWETVKKFTIVPVQASVENGLLTPTQKIRTEEVYKRFDDLIEGMYGSSK